MSLTKYASIEVAEVLDVKGSRNQAKSANLSKIADFEDYRTEDGFLYARIRAISSRVNKNHDGWPSVELAGSREIFNRHQASAGGFTVEAAERADYGFSTFLGKPIFVDHHNSDPDNARGVIVDAKLHVEDRKTSAGLDPYYASAPDNHLPPTWVELLLEVDSNSFPKLAKAIVEGSKNPDKGIDGFSMGCDIERSVCNICKNAATNPDEYCTHIKLKGADFDFIEPKTGRKTSKKSYEDCYGIKFFEISAVFDPADETALTREIRANTIEANTITSAKIEQNTIKTAENPLPQADMLTAPENINTLREEQICPVCGSTIEEHECDVCGFVPPPEGLDNPDLQKAQESPLDQNSDIGDSMDVPPDQGQGPQGTISPDQGGGTRNISPTGQVTNDMSWKVSLHPKVAGKINTAERPISPGNPPQSNEPTETIIRDQTKPVTERTAKEFIAAAQENYMSNQKRADDNAGASKADQQTTVEGVGGVITPSNEEASKADAQVEVVAEGGTGVSDSNESASAPDSTDSIEETSDNAGFQDGNQVEAIPTKTWSGTDGQTEPVQGPAFPTSHQHQSYDSEPYPKEDGGLSDGSPSKGTQPVDPVGKAQDRVNLKEPVTSPENNSGPTKTWTGTDGNGVLKQQDPVTPESIAQEGFKSSMAKAMEIMKLAELEVDMGLISKEQKWARVAELEEATAERIENELRYAQRVRTAGLRKNAAIRDVGRLPSLQSKTSVEKESVEDDEVGDSALFS